jgi:hypothetical protein
MKVEKSDLANYLQRVGKGRGDSSGIDGEDEGRNEEINEEIIKEMCNFSNLSNSNGSKLEGGFNACCRPA